MSFNRKDQRAKRHLRLRQRVIGSAERPRMAICVTNKHMYVQFIDDAQGHTLAQASSIKEPKANLEVAKKLGAAAAEAAKAKVGEAAARIRSFYPAEPYKGKGIKYEGEHIRRKQGKKVA